MSNMAYCRFQNTVEDLADCQEYLDEKLCSKEEEKARKWLIRICKEIASHFEED